jgi:hypothetical protein
MSRTTVALTESQCTANGSPVGAIGVDRHAFGNNPASGRVLRKIGMTYEDTRHEHLRKWGEYEARVEYGLLVNEWCAARGGVSLDYPDIH